MFIALLAALVLSPHAAAKAEAVAVRSVRITAYGPMPSVTSGVLKVFRRVHVVDPAGVGKTLYFVHLSEDGYPPVGAQCDFTVRPEHVVSFDGLPDEPQGLVIHSFDCG